MFQTPLRSNWVGIAIAIAFAAWEPAAGEWKLHRQSASFMGTRWHIALYSRDASTANHAFRRAWKVIEEIDEDLSNFKPNSELNQLCRSAPHDQFVKVGDHLWTVMNAAKQLSDATSGAFDVTIGPVSKLWRRAHKKKQMPDVEKRKIALRSVGYQNVILNEAQKSLRLIRPDMQLDLGGIAKGYAVDQALDTIAQLGISSALVNGGGDLSVSEPPPGELAWPVEIAGLNPRADKQTIWLANASVATSGDAWNYVLINGIRYSHIIDPATGLGMTQRTSATVIAPTCMMADSWASVLCIKKPQQGMQFIETMSNVEARLLTARDEETTPNVYASSQFDMVFKAPERKTQEPP